MASDDVVVFMSYAHDDDLILSQDPNEMGFVTFLDQQLRLKLRDLGAQQADIWRDRRRISQGDQFNDIIDDGLKKAEFLIVVMSPNWIQRPYCRKEFDSFLVMRKAAGVANPATRMLLVGKGLCRLDRAPAGTAGPGRLPFLFARRSGRRQRGDALFQSRQVQRPFLHGGGRSRDGPPAAPLPHHCRSASRAAAAAGRSDRRSERPNRFPLQTRERHEGRLCPSRQ